MKQFDLFFPWIIACVATVGSLFFSEFRLLEPCKLCWYQRVIMFPMVVILGIAAFKNAYKIITYVLPLTLLGLGISIFHVLTNFYYPDISNCTVCQVGGMPRNGISPIFYPALSLISFILLNGSLIWVAHRHKRGGKL